MKKIFLFLSLTVIITGNILAQSDNSKTTSTKPPEASSTTDGCTDCEHVTKVKGSSALGFETVSIGQYTLSSGYRSEVTGDYSSTIGNYNNVTGDYSFAFGANCNAVGASNSIAIGLYSKSANRNAYSFGSYVEAYSPGSMVIGMGAGSSNILRNTKQESLVIGFNSIYPTLFVGKSPTFRETGRIGIGTDDPDVKLHVLSGIDEDAVLFLQPENFSTSNDFAAIYFANERNYIKLSNASPLEFYTSSGFLFKGGDVAIGTTTSGRNLAVNGEINASSLTAERIAIDQINAETMESTSIITESLKLTAGAQEGYVLKSDDTGNTTWIPQAQLDDNDWSVSGNNVYKTNGFVGIGVANPQYNLDVTGQIRFSSLIALMAKKKMLIVNQNGLLANADVPDYSIFSQNIQMRGNYITYDGDDEGIYVASNGNVGINTNNPTALLHVSSPGNTEAKVTTTNSSISRIWLTNTLAAYSFGVDNSGKGHIWSNINNPTSLVTFFQNKVGIGNVESGMPGDYKLYVEGGIMTEKVRVKLQDEWADYVFDEDYNLMPLAEVEAFVKQNKHLPDVPSEEQVKKEGIDVAEMNALLLKKVEELTLHIIELEKKVNQLQKEQ